MSDSPFPELLMLPKIESFADASVCAEPESDYETASDFSNCDCRNPDGKGSPVSGERREVPLRAESKGKGNHRMTGHDYYAPAFYFVTIKKLPEVAAFSVIKGDWRHKGDAKIGPHVESTVLGDAINRALREFEQRYDGLQKLQYKVMPDHLHIVIHVKKKLDMHFGFCIQKFKLQAEKYAGCKLFQIDYNDLVIMDYRQLRASIDYTADNPYRYLVRRSNPELFRRVNDIRIAGIEMEAYGNLSLLYNPHVSMVLYHRAYSDEEWERHVERWDYIARNGGVLLSPAISPKEKGIFTAGAACGGRLIRVTAAPFGERFAPKGREFELCTNGQLLILRPKQLLPLRKGDKITRALSLRLNEIASCLCEHLPAGKTSGEHAVIKLLHSPGQIAAMPVLPAHIAGAIVCRSLDRASCGRTF